MSQVKIKRVRTTKEFQKRLSKLPLHIAKLAHKKSILFSQEPFHPSLRTHRLKGKLEGHWSFSVNYSYRIIFIIEDDVAVFVNIGTHSIYK